LQLEQMMEQQPKTGRTLERWPAELTERENAKQNTHTQNKTGARQKRAMPNEG